MGCETLSCEIWKTLSGVAWLEWARVIVDLVKGVAWPLALFMVVWIFRQEIKKRIPYLKSAGKDGVEFADPEGQPSEQKEIGLLNEPEHPLLTVKPVEEMLQKSAAELKDELVVPKLIRALAVSQLERRFEHIFSWVFQSQINFLLGLDEVGLPHAVVAAYYKDIVQPLSPERYGEFDVDEWLKFLFDQELIEWREDRIWRTDYGTDFLKFIRAYKMNIPRLP